MSLQLGAPQPLAGSHILDEFSCGEASLDEWFKRRALSNQLNGASRTFVVTDPGGRVFGYYAMAAGAVSHQAATSSVRRNMPDPVPVMVLARLAVDQQAQGNQLGAALLQDAVKRVEALSASERLHIAERGCQGARALNEEATRQWLTVLGDTASKVHFMSRPLPSPTFALLRRLAAAQA